MTTCFVVLLLALFALNDARNLRPFVERALKKANVSWPAATPDANARRALEHQHDAPPPAFTTCPATRYPLQLWQQKGGYITQVLGNWKCDVSLEFWQRQPFTLILAEQVGDIWNVTYNATSGNIQWIDLFNNPSFPDVFQLYLQPPGNGYELWTQCSDTTNSQTPNQVDFEFFPFDFTTRTSILKKKAFPYTMDASCQYVYDVAGAYWQVQCMNFETLGFFPPGFTVNYYEFCQKEA